MGDCYRCKANYLCPEHERERLLDSRAWYGSYYAYDSVVWLPMWLPPLLLAFAVVNGTLTPGVTVALTLIFIILFIPLMRTWADIRHMLYHRGVA